MIKEIFDVVNCEHIASGKFSVSSTGSCLRTRYLMIKHLYKETYDAKALRTFALGELFHRQAVKEIIEKGDKLGLRVVAAEIDIPEQKYISGRVDLIISDSKTGELICIDIKSCSDYTLNEVSNGRISESYRNQMQLYLHFFHLNRGFILFYGKHKGMIEEFEIKYNKELCEKLILDITNFFENYVNKDIEPPKCDGGNYGCPCCGKPKIFNYT
jgi:predicted phage-related endonuclease